MLKENGNPCTTGWDTPHPRYSELWVQINEPIRSVYRTCRETRQLTTGLLRDELVLDEWKLYSDGYKVSKKTGFTLTISSFSRWEDISAPGPASPWLPGEGNCYSPGWSPTALLPSWPSRPLQEQAENKGVPEKHYSHPLPEELMSQKSGFSACIAFTLEASVCSRRSLTAWGSCSWQADGSQLGELLQVRLNGFSLCM